MSKELRFALYAIKKNMQSSAELRTSFVMNIIGMCINNTAFIVIWMFFVKSVGIINGWTAFDIIGLQGFVALCFGIVFSFGNGIRKLPEYTSSGSFDRFVLSPKNLLLRVAVSSLGVSSLGDIVFGLVCIVLYGILTHVVFVQWLLLAASIIITTVVFFSFAVITYSASFFFDDPASTTYALFDLFVTPSMFHGGAVQGIMRFFFTFAVPSLLIGTLPIEIVKNVSFPELALISILAVIWFFIAVTFFNWVIRKYESSNFMTFGV
jgi:ABC-2 type transport system permease protein